MIDEKQTHIAELTARIVSAYVANNVVSCVDLPDFIEAVHEQVSSLGAIEPQQALFELMLIPAVNPRKSVQDDYIICLEDGKQFRSLKWHLRAHHNLSPEQYRAKWGLPHNYPMVAPSYAAVRSSLAKKLGLGRKPGKRKN